VDQSPLYAEDLKEQDFDYSNHRFPGYPARRDARLQTSLDLWYAGFGDAEEANKSTVSWISGGGHFGALGCRRRSAWTDILSQE
jgi:hypothetical protein